METSRRIGLTSLQTDQDATQDSERLAMAELQMAFVPCHPASMAQQFWLVKQEPDAYPWAKFAADGGTAWTGIRSFPARLHLRAMKKGDWVLYYHSNVGKEIVGCAQVSREAYPDQTAEEGDWSCVDLAPVKPLVRPVTLEELKTDPETKELLLFRQSRLSVMPVPPAAFTRILEMSGTKLPTKRASAKAQP